MGERELILVLAAVVFFSTTSLSVNRFIVYNNEAMMKSEFEYFAVSLAQKIIEEAKTRNFDLYTPPDDFTSPYSLGPRYNESYPYYSDVDDYHGLNLNIDTPRTKYRVQVAVYYVDEGNINQIVMYRTNHKKMVVTVTSDYISNPIVLSHVYSYIDKG